MSNLVIIACLILLLTLNITLVVKIWMESRGVYATDQHIVDLQLVEFNQYIRDFNKSYSKEEYNRRFVNFKVSLSDIAKRNALEGATVFGLTQFSDMSVQEFIDVMLAKRAGKECIRKKDNCSRYGENHTYKHQYSDVIPEKFDWRDRGAVGPVLDQRQCAACWAFSIVGVMESMAYILDIYKGRLSIQELLDCSKYTAGCLGGNVLTALEYFCQERMGVVTEGQYPLTLIQGECHKNLLGGGIKIREYNHLCKMNETQILWTIANHGPVVAIVNAVPLYNYIGGIIRRACRRDENSSDHDVQIVGFDRTGEIPYYIVRNSWGPLFGDDGYIKIAIDGNICGISDEISIIDVEKS